MNVAATISACMSAPDDRARLEIHATDNSRRALAAATWPGAALRLLLSVCLLGWLSACAVNPVTGEKELMLISESQEMATGAEQYKPAQQAQGGLYYLDPELTVYVREVGQKLARVSDRPDLPYEFVVLNNGVPNAWALPSGKIAINRGLLLELNSEAELAAVMGHEIVHAAARHGAKRMQSGLLAQVGMAGLGIYLADSQYQNMLLGGAMVATNLALSRYSRENELESDYYGIQYMARAGYDPDAAIELQKTFLRLSGDRKSDWLSGMFATHPPSEERVERNQQTAQELRGDYRGEKAYQKAIARIKRTAGAYAAYEKGAAALGKGDRKTAIDLAEEAIRIEPQEALFYSLRGEAHEQMGNSAAAKRDFDKAVALNPEYFANHLNRGLAAHKAGQLDKAARDIQRANELLPTSYGFLAMGNIAERKGDPRTAVQYYQAAGRAQGPVGEAARKRLATLVQQSQPAQ